MKKSLVLATILASQLVVAGASQAITINVGALGMKYTDHTYNDFDFPTVTSGVITNPAPGQTTPSGNVWGIVSMTGVHTLLDGNPENNSLSGVSYYNPGSDGKYYFSVYGGLTIMPGGTFPGSSRLEAAPGITPYLKIYETTNASVYDMAYMAGANVAGKGAFGTFGQNIIYGADGVAGGGDDSTLWLDTTFSLNTLKAYDPFWGLTPTELETVTSSTTQTGSTEAYLDILGGTGAILFQKGVFDIASTLTGSDRADLKVISNNTLQYNFATATWTDPYGWTTNSQDPVTGVGTAIPEPSTIMLLGAGLLGMGIYGRRRMKK